MKNGDIIGEQCQVCGEETFRILFRDAVLAPGITVKVKCCPRCANRIDAANQEEAEKKDLSSMSKAERRKFFQEKSYQWADNLHGKKVIVSWDVDALYNHHVFANRAGKYYARGVAYRVTNECGGWGNVKVLLNEAENKRVSYVQFGENLSPIMDGQRYGLFINPTDDGHYYTMVSWGYRNTIMLEEDSFISSMAAG